MISHDASSTIEYGKKFAKTLKGGEIIGLIGDLGAGKTTFVKGLAEELKVIDNVTSPTFVILKPYDGKIDDREIQLIHIDAYRLETQDDVASIGLHEYFGREDVIVVIEWAEKIKKFLPKGTIYINFKHRNSKEREIIVKKMLEHKKDYNNSK